jgi:AmmeMemoRadiSam system protein B
VELAKAWAQVALNAPILKRVPVAAGLTGGYLLIHNEAYDPSAQSDHGGSRGQSPVTSRQHQQRVRAAAVAGQLYPRDPGKLRAVVERLLARTKPASGPVPKVLIAPHAGYAYSGEVAATAFAALQDHAQPITRVVIIGPAYYVRFRGRAIPTVDAFDTPLGRVPVAQEEMAKLENLGSIIRADAPHVPEHALEVELPFLQVLVRRFELVLILVGDARLQEAAEVLGQLWGGSQTLIVVSSDLSHFHTYGAAQRLDAVTAARIERGEWASLGPTRGEINGTMPLLAYSVPGEPLIAQPDCCSHYRRD